MKKVFFKLAIVFYTLSIFISCTPKVKIKLNDQNEVFVDIDITHTDATKRLIKSLSSLGDSSIFESKDENIENIKAEDGMEIISLKKSSTLDVDAKLKFPNPDKLNSSMLFVDKKEEKLIFSLNRKTINSFLEQMSQEDREYLDLFMAPCLQDSIMSEEEYIALIASAYGNKASQELKNSLLTLSFEVPKKIKSVQLIPKTTQKVDTNKLEVQFTISKVLVMNEEIKVTIDYSN